MRWSARSSNSSSACWRCASRWRGICGRSSRRLKIAGDLERIGDYAANVAKRTIVLAQFTLPYSIGRPRHMAQLVQENLKTIIDAIGESDADKAVEVWRSDAGRRRHVQRALPRADHLHDGRSAQHHAVHASPVHRQEHRTHRRPRDQHRRDGPLRGEGQVLPDARPKGDSAAYAVVRPKD